MKKTIITSLLMIFMIFCFTSCKDTTDEPVSKTNDSKYTKHYYEVLERLYSIIKEPSKITDLQENEAGIIEISNNFVDNALENIGYAFLDLNNDKVPELIIGSSNPDFYAHVNNEVYAVYGLKNNIPSQIIEGGHRNIYSITKDNKLFNYTSTSAMHTSFGSYNISPALNVECEHYYFTHQKEDDISQIGYFHNKIGEIDKRLSEELNIRPEAFWKIEQDYADSTISIDFTPFSEHDSRS